MVELLADEGAFLSGTPQNVWDQGLIVCVEIEVSGLVIDDDGLAEVGFETIGHACIVGTEDDLVVAFESSGQFLIEFRYLCLFV